VAARIERALRITGWDETAHWSFAEQLLQLGFEAYFQGEISRNKLLELTEEAGGDVESVREVLDAEGPDNTVDAVLPF